ncbi:GDP-mannose 4,6-dehydratase [Alteromonas sp. KUL49]|uniref:GDP-mannose 4,6-dehydratase n=1 Tax=Alteromonas sp. KUL49 TaxID=2480798 RepID=UPI00102F12BF|nr:GDP-mannose 4,6-dehydratase [Alteromonas sp. KUL49]TAP39683.1 NAD-dependent epimerase/dehydratase family protein [Alteromonas sp. KUL49]GEA11671.1 dTDP-glucose 4,6-dehydratase [Alteromonas sp. KUL49]
MSETIAVIGSNSFSGASYVKHLLAQEKRVIAISRSPEPVDALLPYKWGQQNTLEFHQLDLNKDLLAIEALLDKHKVPTVVNFAAQSMVGQSWDWPEHWFMTNAVSTVKLHNCLRHKDYLDKYVHISTPEVYGSMSGSVAEHDHYQPSTPYAVSRAAADMSLQTFFDVHQFPVVSTRAANVYGPGQQLYRIIPKTMMSILLNQKLPLHGGGHSERSFIHIDDVSTATQLISEKGTLGESYHISTVRTVTIRALVEMICDFMQVDVHEVCEITDDRPGKDSAYLLDATKLRTQLGWQDKISLEAGLEQTLEWVKNNFDVLKSQALTYQHKE